MVTICSCPRTGHILSIMSLDKGKGKYCGPLPSYFPQEGNIISKKVKGTEIEKAAGLTLLLKLWRCYLGTYLRFACWMGGGMLCAIIIHTCTNSLPLAWFHSGILIQFIWKPVWVKTFATRASSELLEPPPFRRGWGLWKSDGGLTEQGCLQGKPDSRRQVHSLAFFGSSCWHRILLFVST